MKHGLGRFTCLTVIPVDLVHTALDVPPMFTHFRVCFFSLVDQTYLTSAFEYKE